MFKVANDRSASEHPWSGRSGVVLLGCHELKHWRQDNETFICVLNEAIHRIRLMLVEATLATNLGTVKNQRRVWNYHFSRNFSALEYKVRYLLVYFFRLVFRNRKDLLNFLHEIVTKCFWYYFGTYFAPICLVFLFEDVWNAGVQSALWSWCFQKRHFYWYKVLFNCVDNFS